jgi:hypothetical protein
VKLAVPPAILAISEGLNPLPQPMHTNLDDQTLELAIIDLM